LKPFRLKNYDYFQWRNITTVCWIGLYAFGREKQYHSFLQQMFRVTNNIQTRICNLVGTIVFSHPLKYCQIPEELYTVYVRLDRSGFAGSFIVSRTIIQFMRLLLMPNTVRRKSRKECLRTKHWRQSTKDAFSYSGILMRLTPYIPDTNLHGRVLRHS
jgi:hypothetical protein